MLSKEMTSAAASSTTLLDLLARRARDQPHDLAFDVKGERLTWERLLDGARRAAAALAADGASRGVPCAIALSTSAEFLWAFFGAQYVGAIPVALNPRLTPAQIGRRAESLGCSHIVANASLVGALTAEVSRPVTADALRDARGVYARDPDAVPNDVSHLQVTSGTTGEPRAATLRHANVMANVRNAEDALDPSPGDIMVGWLPLHHDLGLVRFVFESIYFGTPSYLLEASMAALPTWLETITRVGGTITAAAPIALRGGARLVAPRRKELRP